MSCFTNFQSREDTQQCNVFVKEISDILAYISVDILILYWIQKIFFIFCLLIIHHISVFTICTQHLILICSFRELHLYLCWVNQWCVWVRLFVFNPVLYCSYCLVWYMFSPVSTFVPVRFCQCGVSLPSLRFAQNRIKSFLFLAFPEARELSENRLN